jgi:hypothetical protein
MFPFFCQTSKPMNDPRVAQRLSNAQSDYINALIKDTTKEPISHEPLGNVKLLIQVLDHALSLRFGTPVLVCVTIDLLGNETHVEVQAVGVGGRRIFSWEQKVGRQQTNIWDQRGHATQGTSIYWDTAGLYWESPEATPEEKDLVKLARYMFNSATDGSSSGYRGSKLTTAGLAAYEERSKGKKKVA